MKQRELLRLQFSVSFSPGFSPVVQALTTVNRFNGFLLVAWLSKPLKRF